MDEDEPVFEPSWPHLQIVYELFLRFIVNSAVEVRELKKFINGPFVIRLLDLFNSEDHRERDYLKVSGWSWMDLDEPGTEPGSCTFTHSCTLTHADNTPSHLRQVHVASRVHPQGDQQRVLHIRV